MRKYKKEEIHRVDMSGRLQVKIIHEEYSSADEEEWEREIEEMNKKMEEHMKRYEENLTSISFCPFRYTKTRKRC